MKLLKQKFTPQFTALTANQVENLTTGAVFRNISVLEMCRLVS